MCPLIEYIHTVEKQGKKQRDIILGRIGIWANMHVPYHVEYHIEAFRPLKIIDHFIFVLS